MINNNENMMTKFNDEKFIVYVRPRTEVAVVGLEDVGIKGIDQEKSLGCASIRVLEGPWKGKTLYSPAYQLTRLVERAPGRGERKVSGGMSAGTAPRPETTAAAMFASARSSERAGAPVEAIAQYRKLVAAQPASREATAAAERIRVLTEALEIKVQDARAANVMNMARNHEKSGKTSAALDCYRQIVRVYPKTPTARTAVQRIAALGGM
jgi:hypothetical protein